MHMTRRVIELPPSHTRYLLSHLIPPHPQSPSTHHAYTASPTPSCQRVLKLTSSINGASPAVTSAQLGASSPILPGALSSFQHHKRIIPSLGRLLKLPSCPSRILPASPANRRRKRPTPARPSWLRLAQHPAASHAAARASASCYDAWPGSWEEKS